MVDRQGGAGTGHTAAGIGHLHRVRPGVGGRNIADGVIAAGRPDNIICTELPLVSKRDVLRVNFLNDSWSNPVKPLKFAGKMRRLFVAKTPGNLLNAQPVIQ